MGVGGRDSGEELGIIILGENEDVVDMFVLFFVYMIFYYYYEMMIVVIVRIEY